MSDPTSGDASSSPKPKKGLTIRSLLMLLKPYFWPSATATSASLNRFRAVMTWVFVVLSKVCSVYAPIPLGAASEHLVNGEYHDAVINSLVYVAFVFFGKVFKECQSLIYLRVKQAAFVQLSR